jgi:outer membrane receptor protein involved in Fe transport
MLTMLMSMGICAHAQQVSFSGNQISLDHFFSEVSGQTGYVFFYNNALIKNAPLISVSIKNLPLDSALRIALKNQPYIFSIRGKTIFITASETIAPLAITTEGNPDLFLLKGVVTDPSGSPLAGASVFARETNSSAISGEKGEFQMSTRKGDTLEISFIGFQRKAVAADHHFLKIDMQYDTNPMDQVVVGGNFFATKKKSEISSVTVIDSLTLQTLPFQDVSEIYRGLVPGTNSYSFSDEIQNVPTLSIRGAGSETAISQIDVYIDGIAWAGGSGYLTAINKENIDRVEILRGPVSSTLYGTGSNGGVVQIFTKKGNPQQDDLFVSAGTGFIDSKWVPSPAFQQYYTVEKTMGFKNLGLSLGGTYQSNGAWLPGGGAKTGTAHIGLKWDPGKRFSVNLVSYYAGTLGGVSKSPLWDTCTHVGDSGIYYGVYPRKLTNKDYHTNSYFAGVNISYQASAHWNHLLTAGYSENNNFESPLKNIDSSGLPPGRFASTINKTTTIRYSNILNWSDAKSGWAASVMSGAEYKNDYYQSVFDNGVPIYLDNDPANTNIGLFVQAKPSWKNIFLTAGLRYDYNKLFKNNHSLNPRIGLTTNFTLSDIIVKPRISWGSGITAPPYEARYGVPADGITEILPNPDIKPQQQKGFDYGLELYDRQNRFSGEVVYYDNLLVNMFIQGGPSIPDANGLYILQYTNGGAINNRGWEFSATYRLNRRLSLYGSFSIMHAVVKDSTGDYQSVQLSGRAPGFQLQNLPRHTAGLFLNYNFLKLFRKTDRGNINLNMTEVDGVYGYDIIRYTIDLAYKRIPDTYEIPNAYFVSTGTVFKLGLNVEYYITPQLRFFIQGSNILNQNKFDDNTSTPTHGASWLFGFKWTYRKS